MRRPRGEPLPLPIKRCETRRVTMCPFFLPRRLRPCTQDRDPDHAAVNADRDRIRNGKRLPSEPDERAEDHPEPEPQRDAAAEDEHQRMADARLSALRRARRRQQAEHFDKCFPAVCFPVPGKFQRLPAECPAFFFGKAVIRNAGRPYRTGFAFAMVGIVEEGASAGGFDAGAQRFCRLVLLPCTEIAQRDPAEMRLPAKEDGAVSFLFLQRKGDHAMYPTVRDAFPFQAGNEFPRFGECAEEQRFRVQHTRLQKSIADP